MNGIDTAKEILKTRPNCRIILFSGQSASLDLLDKARAEGFHFEILAKPVNPNRLLFALDRDRYSEINV
jgi:DNA-binding NtrC family response regulator